MILSSSANFLRFWLCDSIRNRIFDSLDSQDLATLRLVCHDFSSKVTPRLFEEVKLNLTASALTRPSRIAALERLGHHVNTLELTMKRCPDSVLPPLINLYGEETSFSYRPQVAPNASGAAKYGSTEVADLLVKQYPPLFHSSTNVPAFVRALNALPNLRHLRISCPSNQVAPKCRTTVDYALISLRMAIERAKLPHLNTISYAPIYPAGLLYMQPLHGFGGTPASVRRWAQIQHMSIDMELADTAGPSRADQLKTLHNYLRNFAGFLRSFHFKWRGEKGPSPISLDSEPGIFSSRGAASAMPSSGTAIRFTALHRLDVSNAEVDASQISAFISQHRKTLEEFKFEAIRFRSGDWDEALRPLARWRRSLRPKPSPRVHPGEAMEVPLMLSPVNLKTPMVDIRTVVEEAEEEAAACEHARNRHSAFQKWLTRVKINRAKEQIRGGSESMRGLLRRSIPWHQ